MVRTPADSILEVNRLLQLLKDDRDAAGRLSMSLAVDLLLDAREIARQAITTSSRSRPAAPDALATEFRLAMVRIELAIDDFIRAQPRSTEEDDQRLMDAITTPLNDIATKLPELQRRERRGPPIQ